jgi:hypothetical protein
VLINGVAVPIYNRVPSNATFPYIYLYSVSTTEADYNQTSFITETITRIEIVTRYQGDSGGEIQSNQAMSQILDLVRTRSNGYFNLSADGFNVFTCVCESVNYIMDDNDDYTYFRGILELSNKIQQVV